MDLDKLFDVKIIIFFAVLILPGFIIIKIIQLKLPSKKFLLKDVIFEALAYSLLNLSLIGWLPYLLLSKKHESWIIFLSFIFAIVICPIILSSLCIRFSKSDIFKKILGDQIPTAWDWCFSKKPEVMLRVHLKNGNEIIGFFGENSYATSFPNEGSIYLEKIYKKDDNGDITIVENSNGILIADKEYLSIEFLNIKKED